MALYYVLIPNNGFNIGDTLEDDDEGMVQKVIIDKRTGERSGYVGVVVPLRLVRPFTVKLFKRGFDWRSGGALG